jgi:hypothetical protein
MPIKMDGIAGGLQVTKIGTVKYEVLDDHTIVQIVRATAYYLPQLQCLLFSPQDYLRSMKRERPEAEFVVRRDRAILVFNDRGSAIACWYTRSTFLPYLQAYRNAISTAAVLSLKGCVIDDTNQNLTQTQKMLLRYHFKLGHPTFSVVQWIGQQGWLGSKGVQIGTGKLDIPKCAACQYGKQQKTPHKSKTVWKRREGDLKKNKLAPGQLSFSDQYSSRIEGRAFSGRGPTHHWARFKVARYPATQRLFTCM